MQKNISKIDIPKPCGEHWDQMSPLRDGRFCDSCAKTVVDFSKLSNPQIANVLDKSGNEVCGRFRTQQLEDFNQLWNPPRKSSSWKAAAMAILGTGLSVSQEVLAQSPITHVERSAFPSSSLIPIEELGFLDDSDKSEIISGVVFDSTSKETLHGANLHIKNTKLGAVSDALGNFSLDLGSVSSESLTLVVRFIGFETMEIALKNVDRQNLKIFLVEDMVTMGEVVVGELIIEEPAPLHKRIVSKIRSLF